MDAMCSVLTRDGEPLGRTATHDGGMRDAGPVSFADLARMSRRHWWVVVLGVTCTVLAGWTAMREAETVYWVQSDLVFLAPGAQVTSSVEDPLLTELIAFAGAVEREANGGRSLARVASPTATLYGEGVRKGHSITLPNNGGQWEVSFKRPVLSVQVVDPTAQGAEAEMDRIASEIEGVAVRMQDRVGTDPSERISVGRVPSDVQASAVGSTGGGRARGALAMATVGLVLTALAVVSVDGVTRRRTSTRAHPTRAMPWRRQDAATSLESRPPSRQHSSGPVVPTGGRGR